VIVTGCACWSLGAARNLIPTALFVLAFSTAPGQGSERTVAIARASLCVTEGEIGIDPANRLTVDATKMRAYVNTWTSDDLEARFTYLGPTAQESALASGAIRRQFGLKLRAQNACNLVYAMWRIEPESKVVVSIKKNPGQSQSSECGNRGYINLKPRHGGPVPGIEPGSSHKLSARLQGNELQVMVDGRSVWEGDLGPEADGLNGPVGIRSDNARLAFDLSSRLPGGAHPDFRLACKSGPGVSD
jgi:hypothetical protein